ncbi:MAG: HD domain-containing protein [Thermodesulfobacteriota bacterium]
MAGFLKSILFPSENEKKRKEIRVGIAELAPIWLRYNQSFAPQEVPKIEGTQKSESLPEREAGTRTEETHPEPAQMSFFSQEVVRELFEPYRLLFESQGARDGFISLLQFLDRYGSSPSIVIVKSDSEADELYSMSGILQKVTLREHSLNVARIMLRLIKETYKDYENLIPRALVVSLGHDIGKAPALRESGLYAKADHPIISAQKLGEIFSEREPLWLQIALETIREHHGPTRNPDRQETPLHFFS